VKRYMRPGDAYVHADIGGASSCIVRCKGNATSASEMLISQYALQEAGAMTVCRSVAWAAKAMIGAYWVHASQVSKSAPSGEFLPTGSFMIYGRKNFLSPVTLEMGFGIIFRLEDGSVFRHIADRKDKNLGTISDVGGYAYSSMSVEKTPPLETFVELVEEVSESVTSDAHCSPLTPTEESDSMSDAPEVDVVRVDQGVEFDEDNVASEDEIPAEDGKLSSYANVCIQS
jgi:hypothetical protein